jgi:hypothetical protein
MAAHLYWRLNITANNGDPDYLAITEVEMRATTGGADQCNGGISSASSNYPSYVAANAFDNDANTAWITGTAITTGILTYQFSSAVDVLQYTIQITVSQVRAPKNWTLQWSDNGTAWTTADTRAGVTDWLSNGIKTFNVPVAASTARSQVFVCT